MKYNWLTWKKEDVKVEQRQLADEGRDTRSVDAEFERLLAPGCEEDAAFQDAVNALLDKTIQLPMRQGYSYVEPSDLEGIRAQRPAGARTMPLDLDESARRSRIHGAWLGRVAGCLLGKPIEGIRRPKLRALIERTPTKDLTDYLWRLPGLTDKDYQETDNGGLLNWKNTDKMPADDDTNYTVSNMFLVRWKGIDFQPEDAASFWLYKIPIMYTCTAERVMYRNAVNLVEPPRTATLRNPYREWIGAQIRADFFGYVALGRPELAAELAWRDACISHVKNGIYGEMWVAAMLAAAAKETDLRRIIEIGLSEIPEKSRLTEAVRDVIRWHAAGLSYHDAVERIHQRWNENDPYDWCHTISNAQIVAMALLYGEGDFEKSILRAVFPCLDTDCNGATVGSIVGMMLGVEALPAKWTGVINDSILTNIMDYPAGKISDLAKKMLEAHLAAEKTLASRGAAKQ